MDRYRRGQNVGNTVVLSPEFKNIFNRKNIKSEIKIVCHGAKVNRELLHLYIDMLSEFNLQNIIDLIKLSINYPNSEKVLILQQQGISTVQLEQARRALDSYLLVAQDESAPEWLLVGTSPISSKALLALNMNRKKVEADSKLSGFCESLYRLLIVLLSNDAEALSAEQCIEITREILADIPLPEFFNVRTLGSVLFSIRDDAFPLINSYVIDRMSEFGFTKFNKNNLKSITAYTDFALEVRRQLNASGLPINFAVLDRVLSFDGNGVEDSNSDYSSNDEILNMEQYHSLNQILYGPPGTGKTYNTINDALAIVDPKYLSENEADRKKIKARFDELVVKNRIGFVTFHQSFSYEDFVEGLKANSDETGKISYDIEDGIFKRMCAAANATPIMAQSQRRIDISGRKVWKMSLGDTLGDEVYIYKQCIDNNYVLLGYGNNVDFSASKDRKGVIDAYKFNGIEIEKESNDYRVTSVQNFKNVMSIGDLIIVSDGNRKFRAVAEVTGDYEFDPKATDDDGYSQLRKVIWHRVYEPSLPVDELFNKNLSQMTLYRLREPALDLAKLQEMLAGETIKDGSVSAVAIGAQISSYQVESISDEIISLRKPNGSLLPMPRMIVDSLVSMVSSNQLTIDDIRSKRVFERVDTDMEKYIVNGYPNVLAPLVEAIHHYGLDKVTSSIDKRVLIIDEINRGNISNIFGELITLIEASKRAGGAEALSVKLPYSKESFSVPSNLHIIGTMNTADKSLAQVDIALRRRFEFVEMMPKHELLENIDVEGINIAQLLKTINQRIELLYDREHTIGHSFFLPLKDEPTIERLARIFELEILPLLEEYFFEDWERVGQVLGDHLKSEPKLMFIEEKFTEASVSQLMGSDWLQDGVRPYKRNMTALNNPEAYIGIYDSLQS
ncbi:AAA family ATPase [Shewanella sp. 0m-4]